MKKKEAIAFSIFCLLVMIVVHLINSNSNYSENDDDLQSILVKSDETEIDLEISIDDLQTKYNNNDIKALLTIPNTDYATVVPQGKDNNYYLRRLADKKYSRLGSTFLDYRVDINTSSKLLIYGHNSSKYDMPFKILENYYDKEYYESHKYLELVTTNGVKKYEIFSIYVETNDYAYYQKLSFNDKDSWYAHISNLKKKSLYDTGVEINSDDKILILQTCSTHKNYKKYAKKFLLIISKEV